MCRIRFRLAGWFGDTELRCGLAHDVEIAVRGAPDVGPLVDRIEDLLTLWGGEVGLDGVIDGFNQILGQIALTATTSFGISPVMPITITLDPTSVFDP